ncbi:hypothetical protein QTG54_006272 [Skeletonema marinoi]|uniref:Fe2OG dioxygenase domain-containing protein n=1 Tax=Skeletonema marinoi TaxID=267567 RepID=A0AAD8YBU5_9STRA|nr:hypothetical protein QTG54_006272 [Skeletonema marinoi]
MNSSTTLTAAALAVVLLIVSPAANCAQPASRPIQIKNESGKRAEIYWVDPNGQMIKQTSSFLVNGQTLELNSYVNHTFLIKEFLAEEPDECKADPPKYKSPTRSPLCKPPSEAYITVNDNDDQLIHILKDMEVETEDSQSKSREIATSITSTCQEKVKEMDPTQILDAFVKCAQPLVVNELHEAHKESKEQAMMREQIGGQWEEYSSVEAAAVPSLHKATVADGAGGSELVKSRKALQAGVRVPWEREEDGNPIAAVSRRLYDYVNDATGFNIEESGQEEIMSIQYEGRGIDDPEPDRYRPHCDGQCDGLLFRPSGRVATMVMYCEAPSKGGATNFRNVGVHIVPEAGTAAFFSYLGSDMVTDNRLTEHSCCPVLEGDKKIAVQWLRMGVDEKNPWNSFNTLGVKYSETLDQ